MIRTVRARLSMRPWSVAWHSPLLRRSGPLLLAVWFVEMNVLYLGPWMFALDARIYHRAAVAQLNGLDPWAAVYGDYYFAAAPPSLLPYLSLAWLPEPVAITIWMLLGVAAALFILRRLRLPLWWLLFPPLTESVLVGNSQPLALALLLLAWPPFTALAAMFKLYAMVPVIHHIRHGGAVALSLGLSWFVLPWDQYIGALPAITARLHDQAQGGYSAWGSPPYIAAVVVALVILRKDGWQWFAIPALWPSTQLHYSLYALPALNPILAIGFAMPIRPLPPAIVIGYAMFIFWRRYRRQLGRPWARRWSSRGEGG